MNEKEPVIRTFRRSRVATLALLILLVMLTLAPRVAAQAPNEFQVKAAYLYNFGRFVEWPAGAATSQSDSFVVCVLGKDPFGPSLDSTFANERIAGKSVQARRIAKPSEATSCKILFISSSESSHLKEILAAVERAGVLTVSDIPEFSKVGGMIQFVLEGSRIRFEINRTKAEGAGLALSSDLLKVASLVRTGS